VPDLRIALLTYSTRPRGGVVHTLALAEALARAGQQVTVWTLARGGDTGFYRDVDPAVRVRAVPYPEVDGEGVGPRVQRSIGLLRAGFEAELSAPAGRGHGSGLRSGPGARGGGYDVVHAQDCITANAVPGRIRTVHHIDHFTTAELVACHRRALLEPVACVCVSAAVAAELRADWGRTSTVIANGVDSVRFAAAAGDDASAVAGRARWQERFGHYVLAVGGIEPRKGTLDLVEAMALVRQRRPGTRLVVAGGETLFDYRDYRAAVEARADGLGVPVDLLGPVPDPDLPALVAAAGAFAFPSVQEGFGLAAMEALAAGVPVVARDLPVLREVFGAGVRWFQDVPGLAGQILATLEGPPSPDLAAAGRDLAGRHTWDAAAAAHLDLYRRLLGEGLPIGVSPA
jgi:glycosyltransferase-like protein